MCVCVPEWTIFTLFRFPKQLPLMPPQFGQHKKGGRHDAGELTSCVTVCFSCFDRSVLTRPPLGVCVRAFLCAFLLIWLVDGLVFLLLLSSPSTFAHSCTQRLQYTRAYSGNGCSAVQKGKTAATVSKVCA